MLAPDTDNVFGGFEKLRVRGLAGDAEAGREISGADEDVDVRDGGDLFDALEGLLGLDLREQRELGVELLLFCGNVIDDAVTDGA